MCASNKFTWNGSWVGCGVGEEEPRIDDFNASKTKFEYKLDFLTDVDFSNLMQLVNIVGKTSGTYLLDNGDGRQAYCDLCQDVILDCIGGDTFVAAKGDTEFGSFVSFGKIEDCGGKRFLTLARRYISKGDCRLSLATPKDVFSHCRDKIGETELGAVSFFNCLPYRLAEKLKK